MTRRQLLRGSAVLPLALLRDPSRALLQTQSSPRIPSWSTDLRVIVPGVYAYTQASGPGVDNASLSNAGVIAGPDRLLAIDTLGPPIHAKAFKAAAERATGRRRC